MINQSLNHLFDSIPTPRIVYGGRTAGEPCDSPGSVEESTPTETLGRSSVVSLSHQTSQASETVNFPGKSLTIPPPVSRTRIQRQSVRRELRRNCSFLGERIEGRQRRSPTPEGPSRGLPERPFLLAGRSTRQAEPLPRHSNLPNPIRLPEADNGIKIEFNRRSSCRRMAIRRKSHPLTMTRRPP